MEMTDPIPANHSKEMTSMKKRLRSDLDLPNQTDINDPEYLDYEEDHSNEQSTDHPSLPPASTQDDEGETSKKDSTDEKNASDEGELDEADLEDGEIHDPTTSKNESQAEDNASADPDRTESPTGQSQCRYFLQGRCHWGSNCKYSHPNHETHKPLENSSMVNKADPSPPNSAGLSVAPTPTNAWISPSANTMNTHFFPNPMIRAPAPVAVMPSGAESAWERGLRSAKTLREQSIRRKQQDKDFNEKKFNLTLRDAIDEKESDEHYLNVDRPSSIDYDLDDAPPGPYSDRYASHGYSNSRYSNRRSDPRDDYVDHRHYRKDNASQRSNSNRPRKDENSSSSYRRNSSHAQYPSGPHEDSSRSNYRRADDWHDPWERSRNHRHRRSSGAARERSYTSSSRSSSSSSRSRSSSSSSRSRSRSRSRVRRRSPSVTRASNKSSNETVKNGNEKNSNGEKKASSPAPTTTKFLPGRQISSHTLKKAEKSSNHSHSSSNHHSTDTRNKDKDGKSTKKRKKDLDPSDSSSSSSSSSSSDSDDHQRNKRRSPSSSSSDSSSSENEGRHGSKANTAHSKRSISRQTSGGTKKESPTQSNNKKRRDTSSSTGSISVAKKSKLNPDSQPSSTDPSSTAENSDSNKKKEKQKILKKLQEVEKLVNQRSGKTSSSTT